MKLTDIKVTTKDKREELDWRQVSFTAILPYKCERVVTKELLEQVAEEEIVKLMRKEFIQGLHKEELDKFTNIRKAIMNMKYSCSPEQYSNILHLEALINELNQMLIGE